MKRYEITTIALACFLLLSLRTGNLFFTAFVIFISLTFAAVRWWRVYVTKHLSAKIELKQHRLFPGEQITGELIIDNSGRLPIFGLQISFDFWRDCPISSDYLIINEKNASGLFQNYQGVFNIGSKEKRRIPIVLTGTHRGAYSFKSIHLFAKDPFGIDQMEREIYFFEEALVYPKEIQVHGVAETHRMPQGDTIVRRWIHDDIFFPVGSRPYQAGDAFNRIDFKSSAKLQSLYTKQFDFTAHGDICVIGNLNTSDVNWNIDRELLDRTLSIIARMARGSLQKDIRLSMYTNAQMGKGMRAFEITSSTGKKHYRKILEVLARFSSFHATPFSVALSTVQQRYPNGALAIIVSAYFDDTMMRELNRMLKRGFEIYLVDALQEQPVLTRWTYATEKERVLQHA